MIKKYLLCPGFVRSIHDGDSHWIGARELAHLYGVDMRECLTQGISVIDDRHGLIALGPRQRREDYKLPESK